MESGDQMSLNDAMTDIVNAFCAKTSVTDKLVTVTYHVPTGTNAKSLSISIITDSDGGTDGDFTTDRY